MGTITIANGTLRFIDKPDDDVETASALNGQINWPEMNGPGQLDLSGTFRGQSVHLAASSDQPLLLIGGANGPLAASFDFEADVGFVFRLGDAHVAALLQGQAEPADEVRAEGPGNGSAPTSGRERRSASCASTPT